MEVAFEPSEHLEKPYVMLGVTVVAADTDDEARGCSRRLQQTFVNLRRGHPTQVPPPSREFEQSSRMDRAQLDSVLSQAVVGSPDTVRAGLDGVSLANWGGRVDHRVSAVRSRDSAAIV